ncbi:hypothetical protein AAFN86_11750 [Roseomonas sp. CAU 1739]|uniref:hypothetical protein n=1 Tax=Roseomonas sp. CAU 1739 TaxID=3140364 RepID=UPI00325AAD15
MPTRRLILAALCLAPGVALAHLPAGARGPNGGQVQDIGSYHAELVLRGNDILVFVFDHNERPVPVAGATAQAILLANGRQATVPLTPMEGNLLRGTGDLSEARGVRAVVTLSLPGQRTAQARFTPLDPA